ncbi:hypothetical protein Enr13x_57310 [Stieleria neptunia]|uniref:Uncharacterized protein n=1 Tax=Stieleria neptunia TaxID=2527979 RepID=A0A518HY93_9BACT|nr:hypothetical protein Enr13x_57310 [Stieleria neptunia]
MGSVLNAFTVRAEGANLATGITIQVGDSEVRGIAQKDVGCVYENAAIPLLLGSENFLDFRPRDRKQDNFAPAGVGN